MVVSGGGVVVSGGGVVVSGVTAADTREDTYQGRLELGGQEFVSN